MQAHLPEVDEMYQALLKKDSAYEGIFYVGVKTTGIFCRPTCSARKPRKTNTEYFQTTKEALDHGYRACKICKPMETPGDHPQWVRSLLQEIHNAPAENIRDYHLRRKNLDPVKVRRWFLKNHGMTFHAYQRFVRMNQAFGRLQQGDKITDTAYDSGYESLSGFTDAFKKSLGFSPSQSDQRQIINVTRIPTPLGPMMAGATGDGICLLEFTDRRMLETQIRKLKKNLRAEFVPGLNDHLHTLTRQLEEYFTGQRHHFDVPLISPGTAFQQKVWNQLREIPPGVTRSYAEQAQACGQPQAVRAVARANGDNRIAILIPCHRVIGSDGSLTGYGGGIWRKKWLLEHEKQMVKS